jgi:hypothetical protein
MSTENLPAKQPWAQTQALVADYPKEKFNLLLPTITVADVEGQFHKPRVELVKIDPDTDAGEVYQDKRMPKGKVALTRRALQKFQHAAGVQFPPQLNEVKIITDKVCLYQAAGAVRKADGSPLVVTASKLVDLELEEIKFREQAKRRNEYREKDGKPPWTEDEIEAQVRRDLIQARENMVQNAETKAQNRVLRKILALKDAYEISELQKPFALIRFDQSFDLDDPRQAQLLLSQAASSSGALYGAPAPSIDATPAPAPPAGQEVPQEALEPNLDEPPTVERPVDESGQFPAVSVVEELVSLGYEEMKKRFVKTIDELQAAGRLDRGQREMKLYDWRMVHTKPEAERPALFAGLILELEILEA